MRRVRVRRRDRGSATVLVVAALASLLAAGVGALAVVGAVRASHQAHAAADLASLAGAVVLVHGGSASSACSRAASVAGQNRASLASCRVSADAVLELVVTASAGRGLGPAVARSRAGPAP